MLRSRVCAVNDLVRLPTDASWALSRQWSNWLRLSYGLIPLGRAIAGYVQPCVRSHAGALLGAQSCCSVRSASLPERAKDGLPQAFLHHEHVGGLG